MELTHVKNDLSRSAIAFVSSLYMIGLSTMISLKMYMYIANWLLMWKVDKLKNIIAQLSYWLKMLPVIYAENMADRKHSSPHHNSNVSHQHEIFVHPLDETYLILPVVLSLHQECVILNDPRLASMIYNRNTSVECCQCHGKLVYMMMEKHKTNCVAEKTDTLHPFILWQH